MGAVRSRSSRMTAMLITLGVILAIAAEITLLQAEEASLASTRVSTTISNLVTSTTSPLYNVTFVVSGDCGGRPAGWAISEWGVTFGNATETYPLNVTLSQIQSRSFELLGDDQSSSITFAVPDGRYSYQLYPNSSRNEQGPLEVLAGPSFGGVQVSGATGFVIVSGFDLQLCAAYPAVVT